METKTKALEFIEANKFVCDNGEKVVLRHIAEEAIEIAFEEGQKSPKFRKLDWHGTYCQTEFGTLTYYWTSNGYATLTLNSPKTLFMNGNFRLKMERTLLKKSKKLPKNSWMKK